jgi:hypothetical protein
VNLAWKLAAVLRGDAAAELLDTYETERIAFARRLVRTTDRIFTLASKPGRIAEWVRTSVVPQLVPRLFRLAPLRRFLFRTVSQLAIDYHHSALSAGRAGSLRGGDRLPWIGPSADEDNFAFAGELAWQVHVYGEPRPGIADACRDAGLALHVFPSTPDALRAGIPNGALFVVRPDAYIGFADEEGDAQRLRADLAARGIRGTRRKP